MNINKLMNNGIINIADTAKRFYLGNLKGQAFMLKMIASLRKSSKKREALEKEGLHVPPFLIASITSSCNLHCAGCYSRANGACCDEVIQEDLNSEDWQRIFDQAENLGVSFVLLAGGEPLLRRDIIDQAASRENLIFPVFTNGTTINNDYLDFFDRCRHIIPVISIEGDARITDARRGEGVSVKVEDCLNTLKQRGILFGISITVTSENMQTVTNREFVSQVREKGCGILFFIEYVPAEPGTENLILSEDELKKLQSEVDLLCSDKNNKGMIILSFPGDEQAMGGCLAAGRGFFHINSSGGAEPCPFSPYSKMNLKEQSLSDVLNSDFFAQIRTISASSTQIHKGGCTLFEHKKEVENVLDLF